MQHDLRRLATVTDSLDLTIKKLQKKVHSQRRALRQLSKAHSQLWLAVRTMDPNAKAKLEAERKELRADFAAMKAVFQARKESMRVAQANPFAAAMAFHEEDGRE